MTCVEPRIAIPTAFRQLHDFCRFTDAPGLKRKHSIGVMAPAAMSSFISIVLCPVQGSHCQLLDL